MRSERWLTVAGFGTWIVSALPTLRAIGVDRLSSERAVVWAIAFALFGIALGLSTLTRPGPWRARPMRISLLALQSIAGLMMVASAIDVFPAATLVVVAGQLDEVTPRAAAAWLVTQSIGLLTILLWFVPGVIAIAMAGAFAGFELFAMTTALLHARERQSREELAAANRELHATRALLAETSRVEERLRISRDLHDSLGHHLTALSLQLDVASRLVDDPAREHVQQAYALTRLLLSDVRDVVGRLRERGNIDVVGAIRALAAETQGLSVQVDAPEALEIADGARAHALLRSVQEIITNAARHAGARHLWIRVEARPDGVALHARDDGRGAGVIREGHGLTGMRERFEEHLGHVEFETHEGSGFEVRGFIPTSQAVS
ncbi:MAG TPA: histidine kinase [Vicinamibacterales bacterium]|jgi:signal transduction histidine kinase